MIKQKKHKNKIKQNAIKEFMDDILIEMENGKTREQAAQIVGVKVSKVNEWYEKGLNHENIMFNRFYEKVNVIESTQNYLLTDNESNENSRIKIDNSINDGLSNVSNYKLNSLQAIKYCQNCGNELFDDESNYCSECGSSLVEVKKIYSNGSTFDSKSKTTVSTNSFGKCCPGLMVIFVLIAILIVVI